VVDLGAGVGTFCLALIDLFNKLGGQSRPVLDLILVEPNTLTHDIARKWLIASATGAGVKINTLEIIPEFFPGDLCLQKVCSILEKLPVEFLVISMCNLINWLGTDWLDRQLRLIIPGRYQNEYNFIATLVEKTQPLHAVLYSIETKKPVLGIHLNVFYKLLKEKGRDIYQCQTPRQLTVSFVNFPGSAFKNKKYHVNDYWLATLVFNTSITKMTRMEALRTAYFKARMALRREFPSDEIEIKLFEQDLDRHLAICARAIMDGYQFCQNPLQFKMPKDSKNTRPKVVDSISDALVGAVFLDIVGRPIDGQFQEASCGNRLAKKIKSEYIYDWFWPAWYDNFIKKGKVEAEERGLNYYCQLDISSFYPSISQDKIMHAFNDLVPKRDQRVLGLVQSLICRKWKGSKDGYGLPQGPLPSGFLANVYLDDFDRFMVQDNHYVYRRYVDDILIFARDEAEIYEIEKRISDYLKERKELNLKDDKKKIGKTANILKSIARPELDEFDRRLKKLMRSFYGLNKKYYTYFRKEGYRFISTYSKSLRELDVYIDEKWLVRRICYENWYKRWWLHLKKNRYSIKYPPLQRLSDVESWAALFKRANQEVIKEIEYLKSLILNELNRLYEQYGLLNEDKIDKETYKRVRASYRFYTHRAGIIKTPGIEHVLKKLLESPWLYSIICLRAYPEIVEDIINTLRSSKSRYVQYAMIFALAELRSCEAVPLLQEMLFDEKSPDLLKLVSSQALLRINCWDGFDCARLEEEIKKQKDKPKLLKNLLLLMNPCPIRDSEIHDIKVYINRLQDIDASLCRLALEWTQKSQGNLLDVPDILPDHLELEDYPDIEPEIQLYWIS
jgi:hypothetical protein